MKSVLPRRMSVVLIAVLGIGLWPVTAQSRQWNGWKPAPPADRTTVALSALPGREIPSGAGASTALYSVRDDGRIDDRLVSYPTLVGLKDANWGPWSTLPEPRTTLAPAGVTLRLADGTWDEPFLFAVDSELRIQWGKPRHIFKAVDGLSDTDAAPCAIAWNGTIYLFVKGILRVTAPPPRPKDTVFPVPGMKAGHIYMTSIDSWASSDETWQANNWKAWTEVPPGELEGMTDVALTATLANDERSLYLFAKGFTDKQVYINALSNKGNWSGWGPVPGEMTTNLPLCATSTGSDAYVFAVNTDGRIFMNTRLNSSKIRDGREPWTGWEELGGGGTTDAPVAATVLKGKLFVFGKGINDKGIYFNQEK